MRNIRFLSLSEKALATMSGDVVIYFIEIVSEVICSSRTEKTCYRENIIMDNECLKR